MDRPETPSTVRKQIAEAASGTGTRALLWAAALAVVWLNGLEPLAEQVWDLRRAFATLNQERQEVERRNLAFYQANIRRAADQAALVLWERTLPAQGTRLAEIEKQLATQSLGSKEREDLSQEKDSLKSSLENFPKAKARLDAELQAAAAEEQILSPEAREREVQEARAALLTERNALRSRGRVVPFQVLSQRFDVARFYAPFVLSAFIIGLAAYLRAHRVRLLEAAATTFEILRQEHPGPVDRLSSALDDIAWWAYPLPRRIRDLAFDGPTASASAERTHWERNVHLRRSAAAAGILTLTALVQARVLFLALSITDASGPQYQRAITPGIVLTLMFALALVIWTWVSDAGWTARDQRLGSGRGPAQPVAGLMMVAGALGIASTQLPEVAAFTRSAAHAVVYAAAGIAALAWLAYCASLLMLADPAADGHLAASGRSRRRLLTVGVVVTALALVALLTARTLPSGTGRPRRSKPRASSASPIGLPSGFYRRTPVKSDSTVSPRQWDTVHFLGPDGRFSCGALIPAERLQPFEMNGLLGAALTRGDRPARLHTACCAAQFEAALLSRIGEAVVAGRRGVRPLEEKTYELLFDAIERDLEGKTRTGGPPSFRLADLAAASAVRFGAAGQLVRLYERVKTPGIQELFRFRIEKWSYARSAWRRRWQNARDRRRWAGQRV
jgi:hypothetical protein